MGCLIASISAFSRLSSDRELTAMHATGVSAWRLLPSVFLFSFAVFLMTLTLAQFAQPWTGQSLKKMALGMLRDQLSLALDEGVFNTPTDNCRCMKFARTSPRPRDKILATSASWKTTIRT